MNCSQTLQLAHKNNQQVVQATSFFVLNFRHVGLFYSQSRNHFSGPFVTGLEYATDVKAHVVGKPEKTFFLEAMKSFTCEPHETVMIGDVSLMLSRFLSRFCHYFLECCLKVQQKVFFSLFLFRMPEMILVVL